MINLKDAKKVHVEQLCNKNQFVITYSCDGVVYWAFQSYYSLICVYCPSTKEILINKSKFDYSKTTSKHFKIFINEWTSYNYESKQQFMHDYLYKESELITFFDD